MSDLSLLLPPWPARRLQRAFAFYGLAWIVGALVLTTLHVAFPGTSPLEPTHEPPLLHLPLLPVREGPALISTNVGPETSRAGQPAEASAERETLPVRSSASLPPVVAQSSELSALPPSTPIGGPTGTMVQVASETPAASPTSQFPDPEAVRATSPRPDGTPILPTSLPPTDTGPTSPTVPHAPPSPPQKIGEGVPNPQPSTLNQQLDGPVRSSEAAKGASHQTSAIAVAPLTPEEAAESGGWAIQLAALSSEAEAVSTLANLNAKYATTLGGSSLRIHKSNVSGQTIYRIRVVGLNRTSAESLCSRLRGEGAACFVAK